MRRVRIAIVGPSPCTQCVAACCRQNGHEYAVLLQGDAERRRFAAFSVDAPMQSNDRVVVERVLPYRDGKCQFLGDDDLCTIYEDRPLSCRQFECTVSHNIAGVGRHGRFLQLNPHVLTLLESM
jgi:Fe-S-cluster containining protein